jgi:nicotinamidase-related amidase
MMKTALLVIDVQNALVLSKKPELYARDTVTANIAEVIRKARLQNVLVIYIRHESKAGGSLAYGSEGWKIYDGVAPEKGDIMVGKSTPDAFKETTLREELEEHGIDSLIIVGLQTDFCINATVKRAVALDYDTTVISDAHSTFDRWPLKAPAIIDHHNHDWGKLHVKLVKADEIEFN